MRKASQSEVLFSLCMICIVELVMNTQNSFKLGTRLRNARESIGMSQDEAAKSIGKNQSFVSRCETGNHKLLVSELIQFCQIYRKSPSFFIGEVDER